MDISHVLNKGALFFHWVEVIFGQNKTVKDQFIAFERKIFAENKSII